MTARVTDPVTVTGVGLALPGVRGLADLAGRGEGPDPAAPLDRTEPVDRPEPVDPAALIGKRGLRYKDRATQLALCAASSALADAGLLAEGEKLTVPGDSVGVVVSSNLGNLDTVCRVASTIRDEGVAGTSPMDLPNASSNVIASSVAIRFGLRGPNLMVCNGVTSGLDAVYWAATLIRAGRIERALVIGVETSNEAVERLTRIGDGSLLDGAAALVLGPTGNDSSGPDRASGPARAFRSGRFSGASGASGVNGAFGVNGSSGANGSSRANGSSGVNEVFDVNGGGAARARLVGYSRTDDLGRCIDLVAGERPPAFGAWYVPAGYEAKAPRLWLDGVPRADVTGRFGWSSGALGVVQCAAATGRILGGDPRPALVTAADGAPDPDDRGCAGMVLLP